MVLLAVNFKAGQLGMRSVERQVKANVALDFYARARQWTTGLNVAQKRDPHLDPSHIPAVCLSHGWRNERRLSILMFAEWKEVLVFFLGGRNDLHASNGPEMRFR